MQGYLSTTSIQQLIIMWDNKQFMRFTLKILSAVQFALINLSKQLFLLKKKLNKEYWVHNFLYLPLPDDNCKTAAILNMWTSALAQYDSFAFEDKDGGVVMVPRVLFWQSRWVKCSPFKCYG